MASDGYEIELLGKTCRVDKWDDRQYLDFICSILRKQLKETEQRTGESDPLRISLLASLEITDKLVKSRNGGEKFDPDGKVHDLIGELDSVLFDE